MAIRVFTSKDGLPSNYVTNAYQDKLGYLWIGTPDGLSRFDGKYFTNYAVADGLPDTRAGGGFMDSHLRYWAMTTRGVVEFKGNRFISYPLSDSQNIRWVFQTLETKAGQVLCATDVGVYQFDLNTWTKIRLLPGYENHTCRGMVETKEGIYINYGNLLVLKKTDGTYKIIGPYKTVAHYYNYLTISAGEISVSTIEGICEIINQQLVKSPGMLGRIEGIYTYFRDSKKRSWIASYKTKCIQFIDADDTTHIKTAYKGQPEFLPQSFSEDNQGNIWASCASGLIRISEMGFKIFEVPVVDQRGIYNVLQSPRGPLLINNGTLMMQAMENGVFTKRKLQNKNNSVHLNNEMIVANYALDNKNRYWYYLLGFKLAMQDGNNIYDQTKQLAHLGDEAFDVLFDDYRKKILVAVRTQKSPCQFNETSFGPLMLSNNTEVKGEIRRLHQCANGTILFATDLGLIYSIDKQNTCKLQLNEFNSKGGIGRFFNDPSGDIWIIYNGRGLRRYTWQKDSLIFKEQMSKNNGLPSDNINSLCFDNRNNLWVCANSKIVVFSKQPDSARDQTYHVASYFEAEDLKMEDFHRARMIRDQKGDIWLFSGWHLICFYPDKINYKTPIPRIEIENLKLSLQQTDWALYTDSLTGIFQIPYHLSLSHKNNTLGIYFKGISSSGTDGIKYSYQLEGLHNLWSSPSSNDYVSFVGLPPQKYVFKVKAQLPNTNWSEPAVFSFEIKKAFWQTWWFYSLSAIILATGIYALFRYRLVQKIKFFEIRNRISQDLHDEIGASMSGINLLSQMAVEKLQHDKPKEAAEYLFKVKNYSQDVIEKLSDMVWIFNPQNDSIEKLLVRLKSFAISLAATKNIKLHFKTDKASEAINLTIRQRKAIYLISKEAMNNTFKYADCNNIYYNLSSNGSKCRLKIQDDGIGFIRTEKISGNGLKNMQARADEIGASFNIQSEPGAGTIISVEV